MRCDLFPKNGRCPHRARWSFRSRWSQKTRRGSMRSRSRGVGRSRMHRRCHPDAPDAGSISDVRGGDADGAKKVLRNSLRPTRIVANPPPDCSGRLADSPDENSQQKKQQWQPQWTSPLLKAARQFNVARPFGASAPRRAILQGNWVGHSIGADATAQAPRHPHPVLVIQRLLGAGPWWPPVTESAPASAD